MNDDYSIQKLKIALEKFNTERDWGKFHSPKNLAAALSVEASELLEVFMWLTEQESRDISGSIMSNAKDEIGDVMICLTNLASKLGIDPMKAAFEKIEKNAAKYPVDKSKGRAKKYSDLE